MKVNQENTKSDRLRLAVGTLFGLAGVVVLVFASLLFGFTNLPLTVVGILFVLAGVLISGSNRLAHFIAELLG